MVRSDRHGRRAAVRELRRGTRQWEQHERALTHARTYLTDTSSSLVSADRHATIVPIAILDEDEAESVVEEVERADKTRRSRSR